MGSTQNLLEFVLNSEQIDDSNTIKVATWSTKTIKALQLVINGAMQQINLVQPIDLMPPAAAVQQVLRPRTNPLLPSLTRTYTSYLHHRTEANCFGCPQYQLQTACYYD
uniref:Uncharacterized protein n=1 Tax=Romanomermis culicivorax TaxID=13658 RepID=A0A915KI47_ROMCU